MIAQCLQKIIDIFSWINRRWRRTFVNSMITWNCGPSGGQDCHNILRNSRDSIDCALLVKYRRCHGQCIQVKDSVFPDESFLGLQGPHVLSKTCPVDTRCPPAPKKLAHLFIGKCALVSSENQSCSIFSETESSIPDHAGLNYRETYCWSLWLFDSVPFVLYEIIS